MKTYTFEATIEAADSFSVDELIRQIEDACNLGDGIHVSLEGPWVSLPFEESEQALAALRNKLNGDEE